MSLTYRNPDKKYLNLIEKLSQAKNFDNNYGKNRYKILEGTEPTKYERILSPEDADKKLKDLGIKFDGKEDFGGGFVYLLGDAIVAEYDPDFMNIAVYQNLEDTLPKPADNLPKVKPDNVIDTNVHKMEEGKDKNFHKYPCPTCKKKTGATVASGKGWGLKCEECGNPYNAKKSNEDFSSYTPTTSTSTTSAPTAPGSQSKYTPIARGVSDKGTADQLAQEKGGVVSNDDQEKDKFMIVHKESVVDDADKFQGAKETLKTMPSATDLKVASLGEKLEYANKQEVEFIYYNDLTDKEKKELDWETEEGTFFRYLGQIYSLNEFMKVEQNGEFAKAGWNGYLGQTAFSGIVIKVDNSGDGATVARMWSTSKESVNENETIDSLEAKISELKTKIPSLKGKEKNDAEKNLKGEEGHLRYLKSQPKKTNEGPNGGSPFQQEGKWSDSLTDSKMIEDCIVKHGETYQFSDGETIHIDKVAGTTILFTDGNDDEHSMEYEEFDHLLHAGELKKIPESCVNEFIRKVGGQYQVTSHKGKNLGRYKSEGEAKKRLGQVEYFKTHESVGVAEKAFLSGKLLQQKPGTLTEKQRKFVAKNIRPVLQEWQRDIVESIIKDKYGKLVK